VLLTSIKSAVDSRTSLITSNAGPHQIAGQQCSPYIFSTSWQNDQTPDKTAFLLGPNYAAGKDMLAGVASTFKGTIVGQELTKWPDQLALSVELAKARSAKPDEIFAFYPGASGAQFLIQYAQSGLKDQIQLYTAFKLGKSKSAHDRGNAAILSRRNLQPCPPAWSSNRDRHPTQSAYRALAAMVPAGAMAPATPVAAQSRAAMSDVRSTWPDKAGDDR
jgi:hypothetical protein